MILFQLEYINFIKIKEIHNVFKKNTIFCDSELLFRWQAAGCFAASGTLKPEAEGRGAAARQACSDAGRA